MDPLKAGYGIGPMGPMGPGPRAQYLQTNKWWGVRSGYVDVSSQVHEWLMSAMAKCDFTKPAAGQKVFACNARLVTLAAENLNKNVLYMFMVQSHKA